MKAQLLFPLLFCGLAVRAQVSPPEIRYSSLHGGSKDDHPTAVTQLADGGFLVSGTTFSTDSIYSSTYKTATNAALLRTNDTGGFVWSAVLDGSSYEDIYSVADAGKEVIAAGYTWSSDGFFSGFPYNSGFLAWFDAADGHLVRKKVFTGSNSGEIRHVNVLPSGHLLISGRLTGTTPLGSSAWSALTDDTGRIIWQHYFGNIAIGASSMCKKTIRLTDGNYVMACQTQPFSGPTGTITDPEHRGAMDIVLVGLDSAGNERWHHFYGGSGGEYPISIGETEDGGLLVAGMTNSTNGDVSSALGGMDIWLFKTDKKGKLVWERSYGGHADDFLMSMSVSCYGGALLSGHTYSSDGDGAGKSGVADVFLIRTDSLGDRIWSRCYGGTMADFDGPSAITREDGYVFAGITGKVDRDVRGHLKGDGDIWLAIMQPDGLKNYCPLSYPPLSLDRVIVAGNPVTVYPNPSDGQLHIQSPEPLHTRLLDLQGRVLLETDASDLDISPLANGLYLLCCSTRDGKSLPVQKIQKR